MLLPSDTEMCWFIIVFKVCMYSIARTEFKVCFNKNEVVNINRHNFEILWYECIWMYSGASFITGIAKTKLCIIHNVFGHKY